MADLPILFSTSMVRAIIREIEHPGTGKTQTRRVLKPLPSRTIFFNPQTAGRDQFHDPRYAAGDRIYVREAWRSAAPLDDTPPSDMEDLLFPPIRYEADGEVVNWREWRGHDAGRLRQGMHMPRWASRLTLTVTDVRVQRLQEIDEADAIAEGVRRDGVLWTADGINYGSNPVDAFQCLWLSIHGDGAWSVNPWVAAYTFAPMVGNIDQVRP